MLCATLTNRWRHWGGTEAGQRSQHAGPRAQTWGHCPRVTVRHSRLPRPITSSAFTAHRASVLLFHNVIVFFLNRHEVIVRNLQTCQFFGASSPVACQQRHISSLPFKASEGTCCWRCLSGCPVPTGSHPLCCPPPRPSCGPKSEDLAAGPFSQSRSSTLGPSRRRRAQIAKSCPPPAVKTRWAVSDSHMCYWQNNVSPQLREHICFRKKKLRLTSCVLKNCDCSTAERISSSRCR